MHSIWIDEAEKLGWHPKLMGSPKWFMYGQKVVESAVREMIKELKDG